VETDSMLGFLIRIEIQEKVPYKDMSVSYPKKNIVFHKDTSEVL
jgi:hypothetical protein